MMWWCRLLPVCFVVWWCRRNMSLMQVGDESVHVPWDDVRILSSHDNRRFHNLRNLQRLTAQRDELDWRIKEMGNRDGE